MNRYSLIPLLLFITQTAFAQKVRISDPTNNCTISFYKEATPGHQFQPGLHNWSYSGTAKIGAYTYSQLKGQDMYIREDTTAGIVYMKWKNDPEIVLYDYNWKAGDTIAHLSSPMYVESIDTIQVNGYDHKVFNVTDYPDNIFPQTIIEGFGNIAYPFFTVSENNGGYHPGVVVCFSNANGTPTVVAATPHGAAIDLSLCKSVNVPIVTETTSKDISIYPQPAQNELNIQLPNEITGRLSIINSMGQIVYTRSINNEQSISISDIVLSAGIYYYRIGCSSCAATYSGKVLFE